MDFKQKFNERIDVYNSIYYEIVIAIINYTNNLNKNFFVFL